MDIDERLDQILPKIKDPSFLENKGMGNEVGYFIFDYDPKYEMKVRSKVKYLKDKFNSQDYNFNIQEFDLFEIIIEILESKGFLEKTIKFEKTKGKDFTKDAITKLLKLSSESNLIVQYIKERVRDNNVVFITGVGKAYPLLRSHNVLNNLHLQVDNVPVVMFFPGEYSGQELLLFNTIKSSYYRAFKLVDGD